MCSVSCLISLVFPLFVFFLVLCWWCGGGWFFLQGYSFRLKWRKFRNQCTSGWLKHLNWLVFIKTIAFQNMNSTASTRIAWVNKINNNQKEQQNENTKYFPFCLNSSKWMKLLSWNYEKYEIGWRRLWMPKTCKMVNPLPVVVYLAPSPQIKYECTAPPF